MRDIAIELKSGPGVLARIASMLAREKVALKAGTALIVGGRMVARFIPSDMDAARRALDAAAVRFEESEILPLVLESRAGELAMLATRLANGGVAIRAIYVTGAANDLLEVAIVPDNLARARRILLE
jgi:hypothetical protein